MFFHFMKCCYYNIIVACTHTCTQKYTYMYMYMYMYSVHVQVYTPSYIPNPFIAVRRVEASFSALKFLLGFKVPSVRGGY